MVIIPAVDIKAGKCVRLEQGMMARETTFSDHPEEMALEWEKKGAPQRNCPDQLEIPQGKVRAEESKRIRRLGDKRLGNWEKKKVKE